MQGIQLKKFEAEGDLIGKIYENFLGKFAMTGVKKVESSLRL